MSAEGWTGAHTREAALAMLAEAATLLLDGDRERAMDAANAATAILADARDNAGKSEEHLREAAEDLGLDPDRIVRRVRDLATASLEAGEVIAAERARHDRIVLGLASGRLALKETHVVRHDGPGRHEASYKTREEAMRNRGCSCGIGRVVRVTSIRRAR